MKITSFKYRTVRELIELFSAMPPDTPIPANTVAGILHELEYGGAPYTCAPNPYEVVEDLAAYEARKNAKAAEPPVDAMEGPRP